MVVYNLLKFIHFNTCVMCNTCNIIIYNLYTFHMMTYMYMYMYTFYSSNKVCTKHTYMYCTA